LFAVAKGVVEDDDSIVVHGMVLVVAARCLPKNKNPTAGLAVGCGKTSDRVNTQLPLCAAAEPLTAAAGYSHFHSLAQYYRRAAWASMGIFWGGPTHGWLMRA
jgi:hypothetical protein